MNKDGINVAFLAEPVFAQIDGAIEGTGTHGQKDRVKGRLQHLKEDGAMGRGIW